MGAPARTRLTCAYPRRTSPTGLPLRHGRGETAHLGARGAHHPLPETPSGGPAKPAPQVFPRGTPQGPPQATRKALSFKSLSPRFPHLSPQPGQASLTPLHGWKSEPKMTQQGTWARTARAQGAGRWTASGAAPRHGFHKEGHAGCGGVLFLPRGKKKPATFGFSEVPDSSCPRTPVDRQGPAGASTCGGSSGASGSHGHVAERPGCKRGCFRSSQTPSQLQQPQEDGRSRGPGPAPHLHLPAGLWKEALQTPCFQRGFQRTKLSPTREDPAATTAFSSCNCSFTNFILLFSARAK